MSLSWCSSQEITAGELQWLPRRFFVPLSDPAAHLPFGTPIITETTRSFPGFDIHSLTATWDAILGEASRLLYSL